MPPLGHKGPPLSVRVALAGYGVSGGTLDPQQSCPGVREVSLRAFARGHGRGRTGRWRRCEVGMDVWTFAKSRLPSRGAGRDSSRVARVVFGHHGDDATSIEAGTRRKAPKAECARQRKTWKASPNPQQSG